VSSLIVNRRRKLPHSSLGVFTSSLENGYSLVRRDRCASLTGPSRTAATTYRRRALTAFTPRDHAWAGSGVFANGLPTRHTEVLASRERGGTQPIITRYACLPTVMQAVFAAEALRVATSSRPVNSATNIQAFDRYRPVACGRMYHHVPSCTIMYHLDKGR
jgi:hypothetical protein